MKRATKYRAQSEIVQWAVMAAEAAEEGGKAELAKAIRDEATRIARRFYLCDVPGLPATFAK